MRIPSFLALATMISSAVAGASLAANRSDDQVARKVMHDFADCVVKNDRRYAEKYVLMSPADRMPESEWQRAADWRCLGRGKLKMQPFRYRAALAQALIQMAPSGSLNFDPSKSAPLDWSVAPLRTLDRITNRPLGPREAAEEAERYNYRIAESVVGQLGECVVRADLGGSLAVLNTRDDDSELIALKALAPKIAGCVPMGQKLELNRTDLRDGIALSYYRLAKASSTSAAMSAK